MRDGERWTARRTVNRRAARDGLGGGVEDQDDTWGLLVSEMVMKFEGHFCLHKHAIQSCLYA